MSPFHRLFDRERGIARPYVAAAILGLIAAAANLAPVMLFPPVSVYLGSIVAMAAAISLGALPGALTAAIGAIPTSGQVDAGSILLGLFAAITVGWMTRRRVLPTMAGMLFWLVAGPVYVLIYLGVLGLEPMVTAERAVSAMVNGVLTVVAADLLLSIRIVRLLSGRLGLNRRRPPLRVLLFHGFMIISVVPLLALGIVGGRAYASRLEADAAQGLHEEAITLAAAIDDYVTSRRHAIEELALAVDRDRNEGIRRPPGNLLEDHQLAYDDFITVLAADAGGSVIAARRRGGMKADISLTSVADREYFATTTKTGRSQVSGVFRDRSLGNEPIVAIAAPNRDRQGRVTGIVEGSFDPKKLARFQSATSHSEAPRLIVVDQASRVVFATDSAGYHALQTVAASHEEHPMLAGVADASTLKWRVVLSQPLRTVHRRAETYFLTVMVAMLGAVILSFVTARSFAGRVTEPLERLVAALRGFAARGQPIGTLQIGPQSPREIETLVADMGTMTARLAKSTEALGAAIAGKDQANAELSGLLRRLDELVRARTAELAEATARAEDASRAKGRFLATMSHELRTPMNGVIGMLRAVERGPLNAEQREQLGVARESAEVLLHLLNDILDYSKIEAGKLQLEVADFDIGVVVHEVVDLLTAKAAQRENVLRVDVAPDVPRSLCGDSMRLRQIILNLIDNAAKFTERGEIDVRVSVADDSSIEHVTVRIDVCDTGLGMSVQQAARLFTPFTQADDSTTRRFGGTGLGLAICRDLVQLMHGEIGVASEPGVGSRFWFTSRLVRGVARVERRSEPVRPSVIAPEAGVRARVLVVDDHPTNRQVADLTLRHFGCDVSAVASGQEALDFLNTHEVDLVFMDCRMPDMDGFETTRRLRAIRAVAHTPVVALTAAASRADRDACLAAGMDDFLSKPLVEAELRRVLNRWLLDEATESAPVVSSGTTDEQEFDEQPLVELEMVCGDPTILDEVLQAFDDGFATLVESLTVASEAGDLKGVASVAHRAISGALQLGALRVGAQCRAIERAARVGDANTVRAVLGLLPENLDAARKNVAAFRQRGVSRAA